VFHRNTDKLKGYNYLLLKHIFKEFMFHCLKFRTKRSLSWLTGVVMGQASTAVLCIEIERTGKYRMHTECHSFSANLVDVFKHHSTTLFCFCFVAKCFFSKVYYVVCSTKNKSRNSGLKLNSSELFPASVTALALLEDYYNVPQYKKQRNRSHMHCRKNRS